MKNVFENTLHFISLLICLYLQIQTAMLYAIYDKPFKINPHKVTVTRH